MRDLENCCFYCKYFCHLNPDDDGCELFDKVVFVDTPICESYVGYDDE